MGFIQKFNIEKGLFKNNKILFLMIKKILLLITSLSFFLLCILNFELIKTIVENIFLQFNRL